MHLKGKNTFGKDLQSNFLDKLRLQLHGTNAVNLAINILIAINQAIFSCDSQSIIQSGETGKILHFA